MAKRLTSVLIDGPNLYLQERDAHAKFAYHSLRGWLSGLGLDVGDITYFTDVVPKNRFAAIRPLIDWLGTNGVDVVEAPSGRYVRMALDSSVIVSKGEDVLVISGSEELAPLGSFLRSSGSRLVVASTVRHLSVLLKDSANEVVHLEDGSILEPFERRSRR